METFGQSPDPRRAGARVLDTAEGVLIALRGCRLNEAFVEIAQTAKAHNVSTVSRLTRWWRWPKIRRPGTGTMLRWSLPAPRGAPAGPGSASRGARYGGD